MFSRGVLPDAVIRDHRAEGLLIFIRLRSDLTQEGVLAWLGRLTPIIAPLQAGSAAQRDASVAVAFGRAFFVDEAGGPRFNLTGRVPLGLQSVPQTASTQQTQAADVVLYLMTTSEAIAARILQQLWATRDAGLERLQVERGFQRADRRELFGFLDGVRNAPWPDRYRVVFVNRDLTADEPPWTEDGTYMAYLKISQNSSEWDRLSVDEQQTIIGRSKEEGSRLDTPGLAIEQEGPFSSDTPAVTSHVRKAGPRLDEPAETAIFRRGVPYLEVNPDGQLDGGLHFVSFQASLDAFNTIFNSWMMDPNFPHHGAGPDQLFERGLISIIQVGFFFVPPHDRRFIGAGMFDEPPPEPRPRSEGRIFVRKRAVDAAGSRVSTDLRGAVFQVFAADRSPIGGRFTTDSQGHALSDDLPVRVPLILQEVLAPPNLQPSGEIAFTLERRRQVIEVVNIVRSPGTY